MKFNLETFENLLNIKNISNYGVLNNGSITYYVDDLKLVKTMTEKDKNESDIINSVMLEQSKRLSKETKLKKLQEDIEFLENSLLNDVEKTSFVKKIVNKVKLSFLKVKSFFKQSIKNKKDVIKKEDIIVTYNGKAQIESFTVNKNEENILNKLNIVNNDNIENLEANYNNYKKDIKQKVKEKILNNLLYILIIIYIIVVGILKPRFLSSSSIINILNNAAFRIPIAVGIAGVIVLTGTDLSAGRIVGLTALITASLLQRSDYPSKMFPNLGTMPILGVLLIVLIVGAIIGVVNGYIVAKFKLHPFIVTLATGLIVYALSLKYIGLGVNDGKPIGGLRTDFSQLINGNILGTNIKMYSLYVIVLLIVVWFIWNKTTIGKNMYAVGSNPEAAEVNGISVFKTTIIMFMIAGITYGFNGFITSAYVGSNNASTGQNFELDAIAAAVIGGVSFSGGVGKISGTVIGVILLQLINSSFIFLNIDANLQYAIKGAVILLATAIDMRKYIVKK